MNKIAIIILALVALSFGCKVGDTRWCYYASAASILHEEHGPYMKKEVHYGGPEPKIREMLNDPCDGAEIKSFSFEYIQFKNGREEEYYWVNCGEFDYYIWPDTLKLGSWHGVVPIETGSKAKAAYRRVSKAAKIIIENFVKPGWNP